VPILGHREIAFVTPTLPGKPTVLIVLGLFIVFGSVIGGYMLHHGELAVLMQVSEIIIIVGAALGAMLVSNPISVVKDAFRAVLGLLKKNPYDEAAFAELLQMLYALFRMAKQEGLVSIEPHMENPQASSLFQQYPGFAANAPAVAFLTDTVKIILTDKIDEFTLAEVLDLDLDQFQKQRMLVPHALNKVAEGLPGFGIVAAVLGMIITMGSIGGAAAEVGAKVAAAMVGTFLGILLAYGLVSPLAAAITERIHSEVGYLRCIRTAMLAFVRGDSLGTAMEFARRSVLPHERPSFAELESLTRKKVA
jgi:chemotaxis protein MotA